MWSRRALEVMRGLRPLQPSLIGARGTAGEAGVAGATVETVEAGAAGAAGAAGEAGAAQEGAGAWLTDAWGRRHRYLRVSVTERCNLRCSYCMPAGGVPLSPAARLLTRAELLQLVALLARLGVTKVRVTGGEPTLRRDLPDVVHGIARTPGVTRVALTTNGVALAGMLPALLDAGLTALNVSLDSLRPERYGTLSRRPPHTLHRVLRAIDLALSLAAHGTHGTHDAPAPLTVKINTVLIRGVNDDEVGELVELARSRPLEVRFIEFMPFGGNAWGGGERALPYGELAAALRRAEPALRPLAPRPGAGDTAQVWAAPGMRGRVGVIASMSRPFCGTCDRLRLTADGALKGCLLAAPELSLRDALRAGAPPHHLAALVRNTLKHKKRQHNAGRGRGRGRGRGDGGVRQYSTRASPPPPPHLTHFDASGGARAVDVSGKAETRRRAVARCEVHMPPALAAAVTQPGGGGGGGKADPVGVARVAGVMCAKRAGDLVPLAHPLPLHGVHVHVWREEGGGGGGGGGGVVHVQCEVVVVARTGPELEALWGCCGAALGLLDCVKSAAPTGAISLHRLRLVAKSGGKSPPFPPPPPPADTSHDSSTDAHPRQPAD